MTPKENVINIETYLTALGLQDSPSWLEIKQALTELEELKKRDVAMKPKMVDYTTQHFLCPSCNETISVDESETFNKIFNVFCKYCGQRLDWEETK